MYFLLRQQKSFLTYFLIKSIKLLLLWKWIASLFNIQQNLLKKIIKFITKILNEMPLHRAYNVYEINGWKMMILIFCQGYLWL